MKQEILKKIYDEVPKQNLKDLTEIGHYVEKRIWQEAQKELLQKLITDWYNNKEGFGIRLNKRLRELSDNKENK